MVKSVSAQQPVHSKQTQATKNQAPTPRVTKFDNFMFKFTDKAISLFDRVVEYLPSKQAVITFFKTIRDGIRRGALETRYMLGIDNKSSHDKAVKALKDSKMTQVKNYTKDTLKRVKQSSSKL